MFIYNLVERIEILSFDAVSLKHSLNRLDTFDGAGVS